MPTPKTPALLSGRDLVVRPPYARRLTKARLRLAMTQAEVARHVGMHIQYLSDLERGVAKPSARMKERLDTFYGRADEVRDALRERDKERVS